MAEKLFLVDLNLNGNQIKNAVVERLSEAPKNPFTGQMYFNDTDKKFYYWNGTTWIAGSTYSALNSASAGTNQVEIFDGYADDAKTIFKFRALKGDNFLKVASAEGSGIVNLTFDTEYLKANIPTPDAVANDIEKAKSEAITEAGNLATAAQNAAQAYSDARKTIVSNGDLIEVTPTEVNGQTTYKVSCSAEVATKTHVTEQLSGYYTKEQVDGLVSGAFHFKGAVDLVTDLPTSGQVEGDIWQVRDKSAEYAWDGDEWIELGSILDLSAYKVFDVDTTISAGVQLTLKEGKVGVDATAAQTAANNYADSAASAAAAQALNDAKTYSNAVKVNGVEQVEQNITIDGADIKLDGYEKGTSSTSIVVTDTINSAFGKLENQVDVAKKAASDAVQEVQDLIDAHEIKYQELVTEVEGLDAALTKEVTDRQNGDATVDAAAQAYATTAKTEANAYTDSKITALGSVAVQYTAQVVDPGTVIAAETHKCGKLPMVQCFNADTMIECKVTVNELGDVTIMWNKPADGSGIQIPYINVRIMGCYAL